MDTPLNIPIIFLCAPFTLSIPFTSLSLSPLYQFHLSIPFPSLSLSPLLSIPFTSLSLSLSLSYLSLPHYISSSTFLSLSLLLSIILFGVSNGRFRPCSYEKIDLMIFYIHTYHANELQYSNKIKTNKNMSIWSKFVQ